MISSTSKATRGIFSSCEWDPSFLQVISQQFTKFPWQVTDAGFKFLDEKRHCDSYVSCTRIQPYYPPKTQTQGVLNEVFTFSILFRFHNHINHQYIYSPTSIYIFSILISMYISWGADKENLLRVRVKVILLLTLEKRECITRSFSWCMGDVWSILQVTFYCKTC